MEFSVRMHRLINFSYQSPCITHSQPCHYLKVTNLLAMSAEAFSECQSLGSF